VGAKGGAELEAGCARSRRDGATLDRGEDKGGGRSRLPGMARAGAPTPENPVVREIQLDVALPSTKAVARVQAREIRILAGQAAGLHRHNGPVFGTILDGAAIYQIDGEEETLLTAGDTFYEPEGVSISRFDATGDGVTFSAFFLVGDGEEPELRFL
jgi:quercetin dioxygenase-like cupin family protein